MCNWLRWKNRDPRYTVPWGAADRSLPTFCQPLNATDACHLIFNMYPPSLRGGTLYDDENSVIAEEYVQARHACLQYLWSRGTISLKSISAHAAADGLELPPGFPKEVQFANEQERIWHDSVESIVRGTPYTVGHGKMKCVVPIARLVLNGRFPELKRYIETRCRDASLTESQAAHQFISLVTGSGVAPNYLNGTINGYLPTKRVPDGFEDLDAVPDCVRIALDEDEDLNIEEWNWRGGFGEVGNQDRAEFVAMHTEWETVFNIRPDSGSVNSNVDSSTECIDFGAGDGI